VLVACAAAHFFLIVTVSLRDTVAVLAQGHSLFPASLNSQWARADAALSTLLGQSLGFSNFMRQGVALYMHGAGIEAGYGFFAPNVPSAYKLVFEVHYADRIEYELPQVRGEAAGLRLSRLYDVIGHTRDEPLRELAVKMLAYSVWQQHPDAIMLRAVFGLVNQPTAAAFKHGGRESYDFLYAYDFTFHPEKSDAGRP
jgi:hypothetical protein